MDLFQRTETVVCSLTIKDSTGTLVDPDTSIKVTVTDPDGTAVVDDQAMSKDDTGTYHYDYTPDSDADLGPYVVRYKTVDAGRTTIVKTDFRLQA